MIERGFQSKEEAEVIFERGLKKKGGTTPDRGGEGVERRCFKVETRQPFEPVMIHRTRRSGRSPDRPMLFSHRTVPYLKRTVKLNGSRVSQLDRMVRSGFNNLDWNWRG